MYLNVLFCVLLRTYRLHSCGICVVTANNMNGATFHQECVIIWWYVMSTELLKATTYVAIATCVPSQNLNVYY